MYPKAEAIHPGLTDEITAEAEKMLVGEQDVNEAIENMNAAIEKALSE